MNNNVVRISELLNSILKSEFTTINQYWLYGLTLHHIGLEKLSKKFLEESVEERDHVARVSQRILQIGGDPRFDSSEAIENTMDVIEMLKLGVKLENSIIEKYNKTITEIAEMGDHATADILTEILREEVLHKEWLESQLSVIQNIGKELYISKLIELDHC